MANKPTKPIKVARTITPDQIRDEKRMQAMAQLAQRRESFAINILCNLVHGKAYDDIVNPEGFCELSVKMADEMMELLYGQNVKEVKK